MALPEPYLKAHITALDSTLSIVQATGAAGGTVASVVTLVSALLAFPWIQPWAGNALSNVFGVDVASLQGVAGDLPTGYVLFVGVCALAGLIGFYALAPIPSRVVIDACARALAAREVWTVSQSEEHPATSDQVSTRNAPGLRRIWQVAILKTWAALCARWDGAR